ncbi:MAG: hypothetical protein HW387_1600 [Parachlamydiales bacterium]|nr:hypothetical protein [Parachlamydiales bacterium]
MKIFTALPNSSDTGWGLAGTQITAKLKHFADISDLSCKPETMSDCTVHLDSPLVQAIGNDLLPMHKNLSSSKHIGYCFHEYSILMCQSIDNLAKHFHAVLCGSKWACLQIMEALGNRKNIINDIAIQGVDTDLFYPSEKNFPDPDYFTVFSGGKFEYRKGQDVVIRALAHLSSSRKNVRLVGSWWNPWPHAALSMLASPYITFQTPKEWSWESLDREIQTSVYQASSSMKFCSLPRIPHEDLAAAMRLCNIALFPNRCEAGTNLVMMEAMSCALPVIAATAHGHADVTEQLPDWMQIPSSVKVFCYQNGSSVIPVAEWFDPDIDATVAALEVAYEDWKSGSGKLKDAGKKNRQAMKKFTWEKCAESFFRVAESM